MGFLHDKTSNLETHSNIELLCLDVEPIESEEQKCRPATAPSPATIYSPLQASSPVPIPSPAPSSCTSIGISASITKKMPKGREVTVKNRILYWTILRIQMKKRIKAIIFSDVLLSITTAFLFEDSQFFTGILITSSILHALVFNELTDPRVHSIINHNPVISKVYTCFKTISTFIEAHTSLRLQHFMQINASL